MDSQSKVKLTHKDIKLFLFQSRFLYPFPATYFVPRVSLIVLGSCSWAKGRWGREWTVFSVHLKINFYFEFSCLIKENIFARRNFRDFAPKSEYKFRESRYLWQIAKKNSAKLWNKWIVKKNSVIVNFFFIKEHK